MPLRSDPTAKSELSRSISTATFSKNHAPAVFRHCLPEHHSPSCHSDTKPREFHRCLRTPYESPQPSSRGYQYRLNGTNGVVAPTTTVLFWRIRQDGKVTSPRNRVELRSADQWFSSNYMVQRRSSKGICGEGLEPATYSLTGRRAGTPRRF